jgi:HD superfamily phosphohydrolase
LSVFLKEKVTLERFYGEPWLLQQFALLDDYDIWGSIKLWVHHADDVLRRLSNMLLNRNLFKVVLSNQPYTEQEVAAKRKEVEHAYGLSKEDAAYFCTTGAISNAAYVPDTENIYIKMKDGTLQDIAEASDLPNIEALGKIVKKYYLCYPKTLSL